MKKILTILATVGLTAAASSAVVSCGTNKKTNDNKGDEITNNNGINQSNYNFANSFRQIKISNKKTAYQISANANGNITGTRSEYDEEDGIGLQTIVRTHISEKTFNAIYNDAQNNDNNYKTLNEIFGVYTPNGLLLPAIDKKTGDKPNSYMIWSMIGPEGDGNTHSMGEVTKYPTDGMIDIIVLTNIGTNTDLMVGQNLTIKEIPNDLNNNSSTSLGTITYPGIFGVINSKNDRATQAPGQITADTVGMADDAKLNENVFVMKNIDNGDSGLFFEKENGIVITSASIKDNKLSITYTGNLNDNDAFFINYHGTLVEWD